jgi:anti-sigma factor RsiW
MRGKITDQDLTNYALNDGLEPSERLYVESMLAISEECRQDIYRNIEMSQMLETGFERLHGAAAPMLTSEQRMALLNPPTRLFGRHTLHRAAAVLAMAACAALALANPNLWRMENHRRSLAQMSSQVSQMMSDSITAGSDSGIAPLLGMPTIESVDTLLQTTIDAMSQPSAICTPPTLDTSDFAPDFR